VSRACQAPSAAYFLLVNFVEGKNVLNLWKLVMFTQGGKQQTKSLGNRKNEVPCTYFFSLGLEGIKLK